MQPRAWALWCSAAGVATMLWAASPGLVMAQAQPQPQPSAPPQPAENAPAPWWQQPLADRLNARIDRIQRWVGQVNLQTAPPLADQLNRGLDQFYATLGRLDYRVVIRTASDLGLNGPVLVQPRTLAPADGEIDPKQRLTLLQAWKAARVNDATLRAARASLSASRERLPQARAQLLPQVQLGVTRFQNDLNRRSDNPQGQTVSIFDRFQSSNDTLSLRQPLLRAQQLIGVQQANSGIREAEAIFDQQQQEFSVRLVTAYLEALLAQDTLEVVQAQGRFLETTLDAAQKSLAGGAGTRTDVDAARARLDLNVAQRLEAQQQVATARRQLQAYLNRPFGELARIDESGLAGLALQIGDLQEWIQRAEEQSPEARRLEAQSRTVKLEFDKARAGHLPVLDLVAQAQRSRSENPLSPQSRFQNNQVGVQFTWPLYSGGSVNSATRQAAAELERIEQQQEALRLDLGLRVHREYRSVTEGVLKVKALEQAVRSAEVALDSARKSALAGVRTSLDVLNADQQRQQTIRDLAQARYTMLASLAKLHALVGETDEMLVMRLNSALQP